MVGIDLFAGAGGMSLGAEASGIRIDTAVEADVHAAATFARNHSNATVILQPIQDVSTIKYRKAHKNEQTVIFGGPPCQGFSTSNQRTRNSKNPKNWLFREYVRLVRTVMPDWVVFENVTGLTTTEGGRFLAEIESAFVLLGYRTTCFVLNAEEFGVPQRRTRLFIVASLHNQEYVSPISNRRRVSVKQAIGDLPSLANGAAVDVVPYKASNPSRYAAFLRAGLKIASGHLVTRNNDLVIQRFRAIPPGGNWKDIPEDQMKNYADRTRCHTGIYRRLLEDEPSVVIGNFRKNMLIHPTEDRGLSVREAARLQSFPDRFTFCGTIGFQQQQIGNAVPPLLAKAVFDRIPKVD